MFDKLYKLSDFIPKFYQIRTNEDKTQIGCQSIDNSLFISTKEDKIYFKPRNVVCPECSSHYVVKNGYYSMIINFLTYGKQNYVVQKYKCNKCGHVIYADLSSIINENSNITIPVIEHIKYLYSYFNRNLHKNTQIIKKIT